MTSPTCEIINRSRLSWGLLLFFMELLERHNPGSMRHSRQVGRYTQLIARQIGWSKEAAFSAYIAGFVHDIGKLAVPGKILNKFEPFLSPEEWAVVQTHTTECRQFISLMPGLVPIMDGPLMHHERWDGQGYPNRMHGTGIPLLARMVAVADVYSAMTMPRFYRDANDKDTVLKHLWYQAGRQFDPDLVLAFTQVLGEEIPTEHKE